jgi:L-ribulose-5-phosphate 3-epimerase
MDRAFLRDSSAQIERDKTDDFRSDPRILAMNPALNRRHFLHHLSLLAAGAVAPGVSRAFGAPDAPHALAGRLYKTLKIGMIGVKGTLTEKFRAAKEAGFQGVEMNFPGDDVKATKQAIAESGLSVDGSVCATHWDIRHTSAKPETRAKALENLQKALRDTREVGGHSVLLVVGKGEDGPEEEIWKRSVENIAKAVPLAAELGVQILIENVWNQFLYNHDGGADQTAEQFVKYVDEFRSPWVGMQFDIGNHWKYGSMGDWIRQLGHRVLKLDVKGFSRAQSKFTPIGEGDIDFPDVRKALREINFHGWVAAEVGGGNAEYLKGVAAQMDAAFGL